MRKTLLSTLMVCLSLTMASAQETLKSRIVEDGGTGPYKVVMTEVEGLKAHTVFAPQDMTSVTKPLPVLVWRFIMASTHWAGMSCRSCHLPRCSSSCPNLASDSLCM